MPRDPLQALSRPRPGWPGYAVALVGIALMTALIQVAPGASHIANISMLYLLVVIGTAVAFGSGPAVAASLLAFLAFDWFFVNPRHTLTVLDPAEWIALVTFLVFYWADHLTEGKDWNLILLIVFLMGLSIGNHLMALLVMPAVVVYVTWVAWPLYRGYVLSLLVGALGLYLVVMKGISVDGLIAGGQIVNPGPMLIGILVLAAGVWWMQREGALVFFLAALLCHGELARRRPPGRQATEFYLALALGGMLGGVFNALLAPWLFPDVAEYLQPVVCAVPLQLLAYEVALLRGCDVDKPRNLAKSVTVE